MSLATGGLGRVGRTLGEGAFPVLQFLHVNMCV